jgi:hypothetical protein
VALSRGNRDVSEHRSEKNLHGGGAIMIVTDIQACFVAGALFADIAAPAIAATTDATSFRQSGIYIRMRHRAMMYPALFLGPSATLFMLAYPGWESQYLGESFVVTAGAPWHAALFGAFLLLLAAGVWFGTWLGFRWVLEGARKRLRVVYSSVIAATALVLLARWPAPIRLGTYRDFVADADHLPYVWQDGTFFLSFCALTTYCAVPLLVLAIRARREVTWGIAAVEPR